MTSLLRYFFLNAAVLCGCIHSAPVPDEVKSSGPGFGSSKRRPDGQALVFPAGIEIVGKPQWDENCAKQPGNPTSGSGPVRFCIQFSNTTRAPVLVTIPAGTVFISESTDSPNGLIVKEIKTSIPAWNTPSIQLMAYSVNEDRKSPGKTFEASPVWTSHEGFSELLDLLAEKKINVEDYAGENPPGEIAQLVQVSVYELAHTGSLSAMSREKLLKLPGE